MSKLSIVAVVAILPTFALGQTSPDWARDEMERMQAQQERFNAQVERQRAEQDRIMAQQERDAARAARHRADQERQTFRYRGDTSYPYAAGVTEPQESYSNQPISLSFERIMAVSSIAVDFCQRGEGEKSNVAMATLPELEQILLSFFCLQHLQGYTEGLRASRPKAEQDN